MHCGCIVEQNNQYKQNCVALPVHIQQVLLMTTKFGVFSETGHGLADPYIDTVKPDPRDHGLNFKVGPWGPCCCCLSS